MHRLAYLPLVALFLGCSDGGDPEVGADADTGAVALDLPARYEHPLYDDPEDCPDDPLFNCTPWLDLCADGSAVILVTDIVNAGSFEVSGAAGATVTTEWPAADVPERIVFAVSDDGLVLTDDWNQWDWSRTGDEPSSCN